MSDNHSLDELRKQINAIDQQLVQLLDQRAHTALEIGKAKQGRPVYDPAREQQVLEQVAAWSQGPLPQAAIHQIYRQIIAACRSLQQPETVAYLGPEGTYSEEAARLYYGESSTYKPYKSIDLVVDALVRGQTTAALVPAENSTEGSITRTLDLLLEQPVSICGEVLLPIHHQLLSQALDLSQITVVAAHPQALAQSRAWLDTNLPRAERQAVASNAEAARLAARRPELAAIASSRAGELYQLTTLVSDIQSMSNNTTRFLALGTAQSKPTGRDKTSLICSVPNKPGALHAILTILADQKINLTKLESRPADTAVWDYVFYIDIDGHRDDPTIAKALTALEENCLFVRNLGSYSKGRP